MASLIRSSFFRILCPRSDRLHPHDLTRESILADRHLMCDSGEISADIETALVKGSRLKGAIASALSDSDATNVQRPNGGGTLAVEEVFAPHRVLAMGEGWSARR